MDSDKTYLQEPCQSWIIENTGDKAGELGVALDCRSSPLLKLSKEDAEALAERTYSSRFYSDSWQNWNRAQGS